MNNGTITMLFGRTTEQWLRIGQVMDEHNIADAQELDERLNRKTPVKVPVYDFVNKKRLLGHMVGVDQEVRKATGRGHVINFACTQPVRLMSIDFSKTEFSAEFSKVTFEIDRETDDGWTYRPILLTSNTLEQLCKLDKFRLPGETDRQWSYRFRG